MKLCSGSNELEVHRTLHPVAAEHVLFFIPAHLTGFSKPDHVLDHKESFNKYQITGIMSCVQLDHNGLKLKMSRKRKHINTQKLNNSHSNDQ